MDMACRETGKETKPYLITEIDGSRKPNDNFWMNSIIEDANKIKDNLTIGGTYEDNDEMWPEDRYNGGSDIPGQQFNIDRMTIVGQNWHKKEQNEITKITRELNISYRHQFQMKI